MVDHGVILPFLNALDEVIDQVVDQDIWPKSANPITRARSTFALLDYLNLMDHKIVFLRALQTHLNSPQ